MRVEWKYGIQVSQRFEKGKKNGWFFGYILGTADADGKRQETE